METCFPLVRKWITECNSEHHQTCHASSAPLPTRLINVGGADLEPRLELTLPGQRGSYIWLSHIWGTGDFIRTTMENYSSFRQSIPLDALPKTFQDAIYFARKLGIPYLYPLSCGKHTFLGLRHHYSREPRTPPK